MWVRSVLLCSITNAGSCFGNDFIAIAGAEITYYGRTDGQGEIKFDLPTTRAGYLPQIEPSTYSKIGIVIGFRFCFCDKLKDVF